MDHLITTCVECGDGQAINDMMDKARPITYRTFYRLMGRKAMEQIRLAFNYDRTKRGGLTLKNDWHVGYFAATWDNQPVLVLQHSRIEYIFRRREE